jgi:hypothetical protein
VSGELSAEGTGELGPQEEGTLAGSLVEGAGNGRSFLLVEDGEVASDVLSDSLDLGELGGTSRRGLGISQISEFLLEAVDVSTDGLNIAITDLFVDLLFDHSIQ